MSSQLWRRVFLVLSGLLALQGAAWALFGSFDPLGWWDSQLAEALFGRPRLTAEETAVKRAVLVPLGATDAGFFLLGLLFAWRAERTGVRFVVGGLLAAVTVWYVLDSAVCWVIGLRFNVLWVNTPAALTLALVLGGWWRAHELEASR
ncbi:MAG: hypothetical protein AAGA81_13110 [Acidobacteriota bacterium]